MHTHVCMHAQPMQTFYILIWKSLKSKQAISMKKQQQIYTSEQGKFRFLFESAYIYTHALLKSKQWISIYKKPYI